MKTFNRPSAAALRRSEQLWGNKPEPDQPAPDRPKLRVVSFKPIVRGSLRGFATIELPIGLTLHDVSVFAGKNGGPPWCGLPTKPQIDREGKAKLGTNGQVARVPVAEWRDRDLSAAFSEKVVALILAQHPDALGDGS